MLKTASTITEPVSLVAVEAGATFEGEAGSRMSGSWMLIREESKEKALERLNKDIYVTGKAWDMSKVRN